MCSGTTNDRENAHVLYVTQTLHPYASCQTPRDKNLKQMSSQIKLSQRLRVTIAKQTDCVFYCTLNKVAIQRVKENPLSVTMATCKLCSSGLLLQGTSVKLRQVMFFHTVAASAELIFSFSRLCLH